nr:V-type Ig domain protein [Oriental turtle dovepox virus]
MNYYFTQLKMGNHLLVNITINDSENNTCYYGNPDKHYTVTSKNASRHDEGSYTCLFMLSGNKTCIHTVEVRVIPVVVTTRYYKDNWYILYVT